MVQVKTLLIDNYDSYTYNLYQLIAEVNGVPPLVVYNNELSVDDMDVFLRKHSIDNIVVSPGPGTPRRGHDVGLSLAILERKLPLPVLGVCLGMQALAHAHGGFIVKGPEPIHGRISNVRHTGHPLFAGIPSGRDYPVVRYHSLVVDEATLPESLAAVAWTTGPTRAVRPAKAAVEMAEHQLQQSHQADVVMGIVHRDLPHYGVQFHPESIATTFGSALLSNFRDLTCAHQAPSVPRPVPVLNGHCSSRAESKAADGTVLDVRWQCMRGALKQAKHGERIFRSLYGQSKGTDTFWLDSSATDRGRFSFMGGREGPLWKRITYKAPLGTPSAANPGTASVEDAWGRTQQVSTLWWPFLEQLLASHRYEACEQADRELPFDFWGGLIGYLGYELKAESGGDAAHTSSVPDAAFFLADRLIALDHQQSDIYLVTLEDTSDADSRREAAEWRQKRMQDIQKALSACETEHLLCNGSAAAVPAVSSNGTYSTTHAGIAQQQSRPDAQTNGYNHAVSANGEACAKHAELPAHHGSSEPFRLHRSRSTYERDVQACKDALYEGESYELCLTTALSRDGPLPDPLHLYYTLRQHSPAPYAAFLSFGESGPQTTSLSAGESLKQLCRLTTHPVACHVIQICCSSPERFLRAGRDGLLEAKPIKGTARRLSDPSADASAAAALAASEKDQAENLMIVDLLRNDLGRVCKVGSVHVPALMEVESYAVHSLVSTVRGQRRPEVTTADCLRATFPGGSMTGAPKLRSMQILDRLEGEARGIYSGSLGYMSFNGAFDLNIVIRTAILSGDRIKIGAGGAIVVQSDPCDEYEEMRLKAKALLTAIGKAEGSSVPPDVDEGSA